MSRRGYGFQSILHATVDGKTRDLTTTIESLQAEVVERMVIENDLRESNARFEQLAATISDVFWLMDITNMRLLYISPAYETVWGRPCSTITPIPTPGSMPFIPMITSARSPFSTRKPARAGTMPSTESFARMAKCATSGTGATSSAMKMVELHALPALPAISPS